MNKIALIISVFVHERLEKFLKTFIPEKMGVNADVYFIHNLFEDALIKNRFYRKETDIQNIFSLLRDLKYERVVIERANIGEDMGAYHFAFNKLKGCYDYFFFLNEAATINQENWLKKVYDAYESDQNVLAVTPQICDGHEYRFCLPTTYWSIRTSFGEKMKWYQPLCRADSEHQEMTLVWPQVKEQGGVVAQVGDGTMISYKNNFNFYSEGLY